MAGALLASRFCIPLSRIRIEDSAEPVVRFAIGGRALSAAARGEDLDMPTRSIGAKHERAGGDNTLLISVKCCP